MTATAPSLGGATIPTTTELAPDGRLIYRSFGVDSLASKIDNQLSVTPLSLGSLVSFGCLAHHVGLRAVPAIASDDLSG